MQSWTPSFRTSGFAIETFGKIVTIIKLKKLKPNLMTKCLYPASALALWASTLISGTLALSSFGRIYSTPRYDISSGCLLREPENRKNTKFSETKFRNPNSRSNPKILKLPDATLGVLEVLMNCLVGSLIRVPPGLVSW